MAKTYAPKITSTRGHSVQISNIEIYYEEYGVGKPLLFLHGFGGYSQSWHPFTTKLSEHYRYGLFLMAITFPFMIPWFHSYQQPCDSMMRQAAIEHWNSNEIGAKFKLYFDCIKTVTNRRQQ